MQFTPFYPLSHSDRNVVFLCHPSLLSLSMGCNWGPDPAPSNYWLFADLKKILQGKRFGSNEELIAAIEAYIEAKDKSFYKCGS